MRARVWEGWQERAAQLNAEFESTTPWQERLLVILLLFAMTLWLSRIIFRVCDLLAQLEGDSPPASPLAGGSQPQRWWRQD